MQNLKPAYSIKLASINAMFHKKDLKLLKKDKMFESFGKNEAEYEIFGQYAISVKGS